jgi:hypothetical protein
VFVDDKGNLHISMAEQQPPPINDEWFYLD